MTSDKSARCQRFGQFQNRARDRRRLGQLTGAHLSACEASALRIEHLHARARRVARLLCVAAFSYICTFIAGATIKGAVQASAVEVRRSSAMPPASFATTFAVHGAIRNASHSSASLICGIGSVALSNKLNPTGCPESAANVGAPTKRVAASVITTRTSASALWSSRSISHALYAAMQPVTPRRILMADQLPLFSSCSPPMRSAISCPASVRPSERFRMIESADRKSAGSASRKDSAAPLIG